MNCQQGKYGLFLLSGLAVLLLAGGCAHEAPQLPPSSQALNDSVKKSHEQEFRGDLTAAVEQLKIALTIDPDNSVAREELKRLTIKRDQLAEKHYRSGITLAEKDASSAQREFLKALRIRSDYPEAVRALKELQLESSEHTIQARAKKQVAARTQQPKSTVEYEESVEATYLDTAIAFYEDGNYGAAISALQKAKSKSPRDPEVNRYLNLSWYKSGVALFNRHDYRQALDAFVRVAKRFELVEEYISKCRQALKDKAENLYRVGLKFFREQKLQGAIAKWNEVLAIDPEHKKSREYITRAQKLLDALKDRR